MKNNFSYKIEFSRSRTANLSFATLNVNEQKSKEVRFGTGYKIPAGLWIKFGSVDYRTVKPINVEVSYGIKDNITTLYGIINENRTHTGGTKKTSTTVSADYDPNVHMNLKFMFDYSKVVPYTSNNYPVTNLQVYILLTYRL